MKAGLSGGKLDGFLDILTKYYHNCKNMSIVFFVLKLSLFGLLIKRINNYQLLSFFANNW